MTVKKKLMTDAEVTRLGIIIGCAFRMVLAGDIREQRVRGRITREIEALADDDSDVSDAYRHAAMIARGTL